MKPKIIFLLVFLISFVQTGNSQNYKPFNFENGTWFCFYYVKGGVFGGDHQTYYAEDSVKYYCNGDTTINDLLYHMIYYSGYTSSQIVERTYIHGYTGALRNDIEKKQVIAILNSGVNTIEQVLYDFNLEIGDSIQVSCQIDEKETIVSIDSVLYCNQYHRRFTTPSGFSITEGIGSNYGLFWENCPPNRGWLVCYSEIDNSDCENCDFFTSVQQVLTDKVEVYPNPTSDKVTIAPDKDIRFVEIFNLQGKRLDIITNDFNSIELKNNGVYIFKITTNSTSVIRRLVKNQH